MDNHWHAAGIVLGATDYFNTFFACRQALASSLKQDSFTGRLTSGVENGVWIQCVKLC